jgi:hypothetical protein
MRQREDLEPARVREHRPRPVHEAVDAAELLEHPHARLQHEVVGVREEHLRATLEHVLATLRSHRGVGTHRHERRRQHLVVRGPEPPGACARARDRGLEGERQATHIGVPGFVKGGHGKCASTSLRPPERRHAVSVSRGWSLPKKPAPDTDLAPIEE